MSTVDQISKAFAQRYGGQPRVYRAPGRVNLIGEHTDYNEGFVMPAAIDFSTYVAIGKRDDRIIKIYSDTFNEEASLDLAQPPARGRKHWSDYPFGVAVKLQDSGQEISGANVMVHGEVPLGSGLSSSAAIEVSTGLGLLDISHQEIDRLRLARTCQRAENEFVGARTGIMDQFIGCFGKAGHAVMLDCRSLESQTLPLPQDDKLVVCNTMVKHELASSEYNARREQCEAGVRILARQLPGVGSLRDVTVADVQKFKDELGEVVFKRCRHVTSENDRVRAAAEALRRRDLKTFGELMYKSHESLRDDYEVSCRELDVMVELARPIDGVYGARMTGGGFGGCTVNLVAAAAVEEFTRRIKTGYADATGRDADVYVCSPADGAERIQ
ncbi:MAG TPA: galactokinase [Pyrinomonadaceae bacterium]|nr:galactokinase [Pyrinomonadaceae bacterium]